MNQDIQAYACSAYSTEMHLRQLYISKVSHVHAGVRWLCISFSDMQHYEIKAALRHVYALSSALQDYGQNRCVCIHG